MNCKNDQDNGYFFVIWKNWIQKLRKTCKKNLEYLCIADAVRKIGSTYMGHGHNAAHNWWRSSDHVRHPRRHSWDPERRLSRIGHCWEAPIILGAGIGQNFQLNQHVNSVESIFQLMRNFCPYKRRKRGEKSSKSRNVKEMSMNRAFNIKTGKEITYVVLVSRQLPGNMKFPCFRLLRLKNTRKPGTLKDRRECTYSAVNWTKAHDGKVWGSDANVRVMLREFQAH